MYACAWTNLCVFVQDGDTDSLRDLNKDTSNKEPKNCEDKTDHKDMTYDDTQMFEPKYCYGLDRQFSLKLCKNANKVSAKCVFCLCPECYSSGGVWKNTCTDCDEGLHDLENFLTEDNKDYFKSKHKKKCQKKMEKEGGRFCLPLQCSGKCKRWIVTEKRR